jgi:hypothetical protein
VKSFPTRFSSSAIHFVHYDSRFQEREGQLDETVHQNHRLSIRSLDPCVDHFFDHSCIFSVSHELRPDLRRKELRRKTTLPEELVNHFLFPQQHPEVIKR